jgi:predicted phosphate transport protein (TIGR00153 family)
MLSLVRKVMPREDRFFDMFERHAAILVQAADALARMLEGGEVTKAHDELADLENAADDVTAEVLTAVRRSFITPFDRSAITHLVTAMDDAVDEMWHTAKTVGIYGITEFEPRMRESAQLAGEAARLVVEAMPLLRNIGRNGARLLEITERIVRLEGKADALHDAGLRTLFEAHGRERPIEFFVGREVYRYVERVLDRLQDVADEIQGIIIDHA